MEMVLKKEPARARSSSEELPFGFYQSTDSISSMELISRQEQESTSMSMEAGVQGRDVILNFRNPLLRSRELLAGR